MKLSELNGLSIREIKELADKAGVHYGKKETKSQIISKIKTLAQFDEKVIKVLTSN